MKSLLLGSAAALVVTAGAQAADLPTKKGAPAAEYVKVCKIDGMAGFVLPGSDTCLKITGYMIGEVTAGSLSQGYTWGSGAFTARMPVDTVAMGHGVVPPVSSLPVIGPYLPFLMASERGLVIGPTDDAIDRPDIGYSARAEVELITKTNTAYGVLTADIDLQTNYGTGFDALEGPADAFTFINRGFVNWAGITAGKRESFFSFFGGGEGWANIFSPDRQGFNQPMLLAYTATFGGGFSGTISLEDPELGGGSGGGAEATITGNASYNGQRAPDIVASLDLAQGWGGAHLAGVAHNVYVTDASPGAFVQDTWGWAIDGGLKFNLPTLGAGDDIQLQAQWSKNAVWYSGIGDGMWGELGKVNGNGIAMPYADTFSNGNGTWAAPTAWGVTALGEFHLGPTFAIDPEVSYAQLTWSGLGGLSTGALSTNSQSWIVGPVFHWDPVAHLDFNLELLYQNTHQSEPGTFTTFFGNAAAVAFCSTHVWCPGTYGGQPWKATSSGLEGRFQISRDF
jgi:hypothetical protein